LTCDPTVTLMVPRVTWRIHFSSPLYVLFAFLFVTKDPFESYGIHYNMSYSAQFHFSEELTTG